MVRLVLLATFLAVFFGATPYASAAGDVAIEVILKGLTNPCGVTIRPGDSADRYQIFVADSGAGRILRLWSSEPKLTAEVITGFPLTTFGEDGARVGPMSLLFLGRDQLIVGASGGEGASLLMFEKLEQSAPIAADQATQRVEISTEKGTVNHVCGLVRTRANDNVPDALVLACVNNDPLGILCKIPVRAGTLGEVQPFAETNDAAEKSALVAISIDGHGYLVIGWAGSVRLPRDSRLIFYSPLGGKLVMSRSTNLYDTMGLAYSPKSGNIYAVDAAWMETTNGGVFRIDDGGQPDKSQCVAVKIADVLRPSALAFGPDGALYVTGFGEAGDATPNGMLLKITGEL
jgi:hypothetical protein